MTTLYNINYIYILFIYYNYKKTDKFILSNLLLLSYYYFIIFTITNNILQYYQFYQPPILRFINYTIYKYSKIY